MRDIIRALFSLACISVIASSLFAEDSSRKKSIDEKAAEIKERMGDKRTEVTQDYYDSMGQEIECLLENFDVGSKGWQRERKMATELFIGLLNKIDANTLKDFNFDANPTSDEVAPPKETGLKAGVDPSEIKDEVLRNEYLDDLRRHKNKCDEHFKQLVTRRSNALWTDKVMKYIQLSYIGDDSNMVTDYKHSEVDKKEVLAIVENGVKSDARRKELLGYVNKAYDDKHRN